MIERNVPQAPVCMTNTACELNPSRWSSLSETVCRAQPLAV